ncbi:hypothetical protein D9M70_380230 [compost metagenome]
MCRNCTWAWVQAKVRARSKALRSWCWSTRSSSASRVEATSVQKASRAIWPGAMRTRWRTEKTGSSTVPAVPDSAAPSAMACAVAAVRPRPRKRARSDSYCAGPVAMPSTTAKCAAHTGGSLGVRGRRVAIRAPNSGRYSVCTNILAKAGWASSAAGGASTTSA